MKRAAILDLGTNTFHLLIADIGRDKAPFPVFQETIAVKLGEGGINKGHIDQSAFERGIIAIKKFKAEIDNYKPDLIRAVATSAIRSASNGQEFIQKVRSETGIELHIIDGDQEAEWICQGVRAAVKMTDTALIVDIGGGSVEFILCNDQQIFWKRSYTIGAARLMEQFHHSDPISEREVKALYTYLDSTLAGLKEKVALYKPNMLIGSSGAFETFAEMTDPHFCVNFERPEYIFNLKEFQTISNIILRSTHNERTQMPAIIPVRIDMIIVSTILVKHILGITEFESLKLSTYSLKEGVLFDLLKTEHF